MNSRDSTKVSTNPETEFGPKELVDLWKYFEGIGNNAKSQMTSVVGWMLTFAGGLFSYIVGYTFIQKLPNGNVQWCLRDAQVAYAAGMLGVCVCVLALIMIWEFQEHTYRNWARATRCKTKVPQLHSLVTDPDETEIEPLEKLDDFRPRGSRVALIFALYYVVSAAFLALIAAAILMHAFPQWSPLGVCESASI